MTEEKTGKVQDMWHKWAVESAADTAIVLQRSKDEGIITIETDPLSPEKMGAVHVNENVFDFEALPGKVIERKRDIVGVVDKSFPWEYSKYHVESGVRFFYITRERRSEFGA